jgi:hypothetical protein
MFSFPAGIMSGVLDLRPTDVPNCTFFGFSDKTVVESPGGLVTRIIDQSTFGRHLDFLSGQTYHDTDTDALLFTPQDSFQTTARYSDLFTTTGYTFYLVVELMAVNSQLNHKDGDIIIGSSANNFGFNITGTTAVTNSQHWYFISPTVHSVQRSITPLPRKCIIMGMFSGTTLTIAVNGTASSFRTGATQTAVPSAYTDLVTLGSPSGINGFTGRFWGLTTANIAHNLTVQNNIFNKLKARYNIP